MAKSMVFMALLSLVLLIQNIDASNEFVVESTTCNQWNERSRLQVGDTVVFTYEVDKSLVVKIKQEDYIVCNAPSPVNAKSDGYSVVKLNQTGSHYFVSGIIEIKNDKVIVQVIADKRLTTPTTSTPDPTPSCKTETIVIYVMSGLLCIVLLSVMFIVFVMHVVACMEENEQVHIIRMAIRLVVDVHRRICEN